DGSPENPKATHPLEVWTGINFGLAAFLVQMGMKDEAFKLTQAVVQQIYENGLQFLLSLTIRVLFILLV
ncbi:hypothetical protein VF10_38275, partial [Nostoc linckia z13]|uniref:GH116 family glycosyl hydrolase n=1 Tax=Nostoc linckia TaxID=92942 RepID=UPI000C0385CA